MKSIIISLLFTIPFLSMKNKDIIIKPPIITYNIEYLKLKQNFKWMNKQIYILIKKECNKRKINIILFCSLIQNESGTYCSDELKNMVKVTSWAGAIGIAQIMPIHVIPKKTYNYIKHRLKRSKDGYYHFKNRKFKTKSKIRHYLAFPILKNPAKNIQIGVWYFSQCLKKARKLKCKSIYCESARMYNAGLYNKRYKYKNWAYVHRIYKKYKQATI